VAKSNVHKDRFSTNPTVKRLLEHVKAEKALQKERNEAYFYDDRLEELLKKNPEIDGTNGTHDVISETK